MTQHPRECLLPALPRPLSFSLIQIQDVFDLILKEVECRRHVLKDNERPKLKLLALRYGVSVDSIRKCAPPPSHLVNTDLVF